MPRPSISLRALGFAAVFFAFMASVSATADATYWGGSQPNCGAAIPKSTGGYWQCTFSEGFNGEVLNPYKWVAQRTDTTGYRNGPSACFMASPNNIQLSNGTLKLIARKEPAPFTCKNPYGDFTTQYTSGMISTAGGRFSQAYGRFEFRARVSSAQTAGLHSALWLWPVNATRYGAYPASGEIDVAEMYSAYPDRAIPYIHYTPAQPDPNVTNTSCMIANLSAFHRYAVEWTQSSIQTMYDGRTCLQDAWNPASPLTKPQPFDQPFFIALTQALGVGTNAFDSASTPLPARLEVDYVRVWK
jgi:beta-glucanase (GH16 family)